MRFSRLAAAAVSLALVVAAAAPALSAQAVVDPARRRLLDVPFLPQPEDLCGGAAVAMVMRYWGAAQIYPHDFAALVDPVRAGIATDVLAADVARRGWRAPEFAPAAGAAAGWLAGHIASGRPVIALIAIGQDRYHYVVVVAATPERVVAHDPARAPFREFTPVEFDQAWAAAGRWALLVLPGDTAEERPARAPSAATSETAGDGPCADAIARLVALAHSGDLTTADTGLESATVICPESAAAWRELAGVRFLQAQWAEAANLAEHAARLEPDDTGTLDLLATSRFLNDEPEPALAAWNRLGQPAIDVLRIEGANRTRQPVIADLLDLPPRRVLTVERWRHADRRLAALPSAATTRLRYRPLPGGLAQLDAVVVERPALPRGLGAAAAAAIRGAVHREVRVEAASLTGSGELWSAAWRWWAQRPRVAFGLALPSPASLPGVTTLDAVWERATYRAAPDSEVQQTRRRAALALGDWATSRVRWRLGAAHDRWDARRHLSTEGALGLRGGGRLALDLDAAAWAPLGGRQGFGRAAVAVAARTSREPRQPAWAIDAGVIAASAAAPFDLWPGAGTGLARTALLRAHPLLTGGVVTGPAFGRRLAHATVEYRRPWRSWPWATLGVAGFADAAHAWQRPAGGNAGHIDAGVGLRLDLPGQSGGLRLDAARGLGDGRLALSAAWQAPWPGR